MSYISRYALPALALLAVIPSFAQPFNYRITTLAGSNPIGDGGPATSAFLYYPQGLAVDSQGNLFIADTGNHRIRRVATDGTISTFAGTGTAGSAGDGGPADGAQLASPQALAIDPDGTVYIADSGNSRIRKVSPAGTITTITAGYSINGLVTDGRGTVYFCDSTNRIRKVDARGQVTVIAGTGQSVYSGDGGPATQAGLAFPRSLTIDPNGNLYFAETSSVRVRKIDNAGIITSVIGRDNAQIIDTTTGSPYCVTWTSNGLYVAYYSFLYQVQGNAVTRIATGNSFDDGPIFNATFDLIYGLAAAPDGAIYVTDYWNSRVRRIRSSAVATIAGRSRYGGDGGPAASALFFEPRNVVYDGLGNLFVTDNRNSRVRKITPDGVITTVAGTGIRGASGATNSDPLRVNLYFPHSMAFDSDGNLLFSDLARVLALTPSGALRNFAGRGSSGFGGDGAAANAATVRDIMGMAADAKGNVYLADAYNYRIRQVDASGIVRTVAGNGTNGFAGDGGPATQARLASPQGVAVAPNGELYIADTFNRRIRKVGANGIITTVAGTGVYRRGDDGVPAASATLMNPIALAFDPAGNLFIVENGGNSVSVISKGVFYRVAGNGLADFAGDDGLASAASLANPSGIAIDSKGNIVIVDTGNGRIRMLTSILPSRLLAVSGDKQSGKPAARLASPLVVRVTSSDGLGLANIPVTFVVASGTATLSRNVVSTDGSGGASVVATLGSTPGPVVVRATVQDLAPVSFELTIEGQSTPQTMRITEVRSAGPSNALVEGLAENMWIDVYADNLPQIGRVVVLPDGDPFPKQLSGLCLEVGGTFALIRAVDSRKVTAVVPALAGTSTQVRIFSSCGQTAQRSTEPVVYPVQAASPELLAAGEPGEEYAVALRTPEADAKPGASVQILAIGLGTADSAGSPTASVSVRLGEIELSSDSVKPALDPINPGLFVVTLTLPADLPPGKYPVEIQAASYKSRTGAQLTVVE
ncbi:MAG: hypothetical protein HY820_26505 [Acidobacteria bacterium]|nr:hypothetical protein [Acidobacteriota bacterium]